MAGKTPIKIKTETEQLLYKAYSEEKAENENLRQIIQNMQAQIDELQKELRSLKTEREMPQKDQEAISMETSLQCTEYCTDEDELAKETEWVRAKSRKKRKMNTSPAQQHEIPEDIPNKEKTKRIPPPPPIIVDSVENYQSFYDQLSHNVTSDQFTTKIISGKGVKINAKDCDSYKSITKLLNESAYLWHSYENKQQRPIRVMVKNLHFTCKPERIVEDLQNKGFKIENATNKLSWKTKEPLNMFMLTFNNEEDINKIHGIKAILGCKIEVHPIKTSTLVPQCKRCQAYGHTQKYCSKEPRCVKCTGKHLTRDCKKPAEAKPKCVHCGEQHPANYRGCLVAKEMQSIRTRLTKQKSGTKLQQSVTTSVKEVKVQRKMSNLRVPGKSYAQTIAKNTNEPIATNEVKSVSMEEKIDEVLKLMTLFDGRLKRLENGTKTAVSKVSTQKC